MKTLSVIFLFASLIAAQNGTVLDNATATHEGTVINYGAKSIPIIFGSSSIFFKRNDSRL